MCNIDHEHHTRHWFLCCGSRYCLIFWFLQRTVMLRCI